MLQIRTGLYSSYHNSLLQCFSKAIPLKLMANHKNCLLETGKQFCSFPSVFVIQPKCLFDQSKGRKFIFWTYRLVFQRATLNVGHGLSAELVWWKGSGEGEAPGGETTSAAHYPILGLILQITSRALESWHLRSFISFSSSKRALVLAEK